MIRPLTFLCLIAACGSGLYLYSEKHKAILLDRDIAHAIHGTEAARQRTGLLRAEWALLNDPGRLQDMSDKYLALKPMAPGQFVQLADLSTRLPPPAPPGSQDAAPDDAVVAAADTPAPDLAAPASPAPAADAPPAPPAPATVAAKAEPPHPAPARPAPKQLARATAKKISRPTAVASRDPLPHDGPLARGTMLPLAGLPQGSARMVSAMARPMRPVSRPAIVSAYPAAIGAASYVGSALAGGANLPPPVPYR